MRIRHARPRIQTALAFALVMAAGVACSSGIEGVPPPSPGPFPVEGVLQVTKDFAYYHKLLWSPQGDWIAAGRCPVVNFMANCLDEQKTVLLDPGGAASSPASLPSNIAERTVSFPVDWHPDGSRLLLYLAEFPSAGSAEYRFRYLMHSPSSQEFSDLLFDGTLIAWDSYGERLLVTRPLEGEDWLLGWMDPDTREITPDLQYSGVDRPLGEFALSPDDRILLQGDSPLPATCRTVYGYVLGSGEPFEVYLENACFPAWSPDGSRLAYAKPPIEGEIAQLRLIISDADGSTDRPVFAAELPYSMASPAWSPDGKRLAFTYASEGNANAVYIVAAPQSP